MSYFEMLLNLVFVFIFFLCVIFWRKRPRRFPPGPFSWPFVGNFAQVGMEPYKSVMTMKKKYGNIIGIDLGSRRTIFINDYKLLKEALNMIVFSGRPDLSHIDNPFTGKTGGLSTTSGKTWMEQRRFAFLYIQSSLRNGIPVETLVENEAKELIDNLKKFGKGPISTDNAFTISVVNSLWLSIAGEKYCCNDEKYLQLTHHAERFLADAAAQGIPVFFPLLSKMMPRLTGYERLLSHLKPLFKFCQEIIDVHEQTFVEDIERDFVDCYLRKIKSTTDPESSFFKDKGYENLCQSLLHLFLSGSETVSTTLRWVVFLLAHYQDIQEKLIYSLERFHKSGTQKISLKDRPMLPYVEAVIFETMRYSSITPVSIFHETTDDVEFHGYLIPKGTIVTPNLYGIHHDPEVWGDPENFRPERFLTEDETEVIKHPALLPFSTGRRICPGESLARDELFIFTVNLVESFKMEFDPSSPIPPLDYIFGSTLMPVEHKILFQNRL